MLLFMNKICKNDFHNGFLLNKPQSIIPSECIAHDSSDSEETLSHFWPDSPELVMRTGVDLVIRLTSLLAFLFWCTVHCCMPNKFIHHLAFPAKHILFFMSLQLLYWSKFEYLVTLDPKAFWEMSSVGYNWPALRDLLIWERREWRF